jgi:hypothetical protein
MNEVKIGSYTGTGAIKNIEIGWIPDYVRVVNVTDGDDIGEWFKGMTDDTAIDIAAAVAANAAGGISDYVGDATHAPGFTVGVDYSENAKVFRYVALRSGPGAFSA